MIITDLRQTPQHFDTVADRIWRAWWEPDGQDLMATSGALRAVVDADDFPFTLVASDTGRFRGTVTAIQSDISDRPDLGPCIAALWVEPDYRGRGIGRALIEAALQRLSASDAELAYLAAKPHLIDFYRQLGWTVIEHDVGADRLGVLVRALP